MQTQKKFAQTVILEGLFILNGYQTYLEVYQDKISFLNSQGKKIVYFNQDTIFEILYNEQKPYGIKFIKPQQYKFISNNWQQAKKWQNVLIKRIKQKNFHQYYRPIKKIGKGNFASVYLAHNKKDDCLVAVKAFVKDIAYKNNGRNALNNEIYLLRKLSSNYILKLYGVYQTGNSLYIVTEYIEGMNLQNYLKINKGKLNYENRRTILKMILQGLAELEKHRILHRDLKPENIMISRDGKSLKIVDFGLATQIDLDDYIFVRCGTPGYVAPQILKIKDSEKPVLECKSDLFSLGSIFYQMIFEKRLFDAYEHEDVLNQNRACVIKFTQQMKNSISFDQADLLQKLLAITPSQRISASEALDHPYIVQKTINIFGSVRNRITKEFHIKASRKRITSLDKNINAIVFKSLPK